MNRNADDRKLGERGDADAPARFDDDGFYRAMANRSRRRVLYHLLAVEESTVSDLATVLVDRRTMTTAEERRDREIELHHVHLPLLAAEDLVDYDPATGTVELVDLDPAVCDLVERSLAD